MQKTYFPAKFLINNDTQTLNMGNLFKRWPMAQDLSIGWIVVYTVNFIVKGLFFKVNNLVSLKLICTLFRKHNIVVLFIQLNKEDLFYQNESERPIKKILPIISLVRMWYITIRNTLSESAKP